MFPRPASYSLVLVPAMLALASASGADPGASDPGASDRGVSDRGAPDASAPEVLGTLEATVDGSTRTWYVVAGPASDGPYSSAVWLALGDDPTAVLGGLDEAEPGISAFRRGSADGAVAASLGSYAGSALNLTVPLAGAARHSVGEGSAIQVILVTDATVMDPGAMFVMVEGVLVVEEAGVTDGAAHARGTFSGRMERGSDGATMTFADGRFDVRGIPSVETMQPGG